MQEGAVIFNIPYCKEGAQTGLPKVTLFVSPHYSCILSQTNKQE